jgi:hypothetical protein
MQLAAGKVAESTHSSRIVRSGIKVSLLALGLACSLSACSEDDGDPAQPASEAQPLTYYEDVLPVFERSCLGCHVADGIGPFPLDDYATARQHAGEIAAAVEERRMPPYLVTNDGTCGEFSTPSLSTEEIQTITGWATAGALAGTQRDAVLPGIDHLSGAVTLHTPEFTPTRGGTALDKNDDYRCFLLDAPEDVKVITGYNVVPGDPKIVHHVVVSVIDPEATGHSHDGEPMPNREVIAALDAQDPDVIGWKCFGLAGEGVEVSAIPTVWAPGQGVVHYPDQAGIPVTPNNKLVVQVHYNLEDPETLGSMDSTTLELELKDVAEVENIGIYLPSDPFLDSILRGEEPYVLMPGLASEPFSWSATFGDLGLAGLPGFKLWGVFPHMHELGHRYSVELDTGSGSKKCMTEVNQWDFHWQHLYFSSQPQVLTPDASVHVTCDYDTRGRSEPILPGWGTQNEMCFLGLFVTVPNTAR